MRKTTIVALATGILWGVGCQKSDVTPVDAPSATISADVQNCDVISFNNAAVGAYLTSVNSDGGVAVGIASSNPHHPDKAVSARVFQSSGTISSWEDYDLGSPNQMYPSGIGVGAGGASNTSALGNILVIQNFDWPVPSLANPEPNDEDFDAPVGSFSQVGTLTFTFPNPVTATSLTVIDVEQTPVAESEWGAIRMYNAAGTQVGSTVYMPHTGDNGVAVVPLGNVANVKTVVVSLGGSIGIDNLAFCTPPPPPTNGSQCTYTQGYWKNHAWPSSVNGMTIGGISYTNAQLLTILRSPVQGNGYVSLMYQLIAARLNIANGSSSTAITQALADAEALLAGKNLSGPRNTWPTISPSLTSATATTLDRYNNGLIGPGHCD